MKELFPLKIIAIIFLSWKKNAIYNSLVLLKVKKKQNPDMYVEIMYKKQ